MPVRCDKIQFRYSRSHVDNKLSIPISFFYSLVTRGMSYCIDTSCEVLLTRNRKKLFIFYNLAVNCFLLSFSGIPPVAVSFLS